MNQIFYKKMETNKSKTRLVLEIIWSKIKITLLHFAMLLLSILSVSGLLIRTALYSLIVLYVIIPLSPWPDFKLDFINLWIIIFALVGIVRVEFGFREPYKRIKKVPEEKKDI